MQSAFTEEFEDLYCKKITPDLLGNWIKRDHELSMAYKAMNRYIRGDGFFMDSKDKHLVEYSNQLYVLPSMQHFTKYRPFPDNLKAPVRVLDKHSFNSEKNEISENILRLMDAATSEILMQNPYIEFTPTALQAMRRADARGVKIIIHTTSPASSDSLMSQVFFAEEWKNHLASMPNMRIYAFTGKKVLHSKIFIFDNQISIVGTYNMDYMSEQINSEVVAVVNSEKFSADLHKSVDEDIAESMEYKIRINNGQIEVIQGPRTVTDSTTMLKLDLLRKIKILRPLI
jgi:phosphatidylserine/phosphatidylglycerophosphate/cardiolipin synthase-like enzyme